MPDAFINRPKQILALLLLGSALSLHAGVTLTRDGTAIAVIVHNGNTEISPQIPKKPLGVNAGTILPAVEELQGYLEKITGAELPLVATVAEAGDRPAIILELVDSVPGASDRDTGEQAYHIKTDGNHIVLTAANLLGLHNAVYGFLEDHLGCHFYSYRTRRAAHGASFYQGPGHEVIPEHPTLTVDAIDDFQEPAIACRGLIFRMGGYPWILKNRGIGVGNSVSGAINAGHNLYQLLPPEDQKRRGTVIKGLFEEHPEFYPMSKSGKRHPETWNMGICGTAEELPKYLATALIGNRPETFSGIVEAGQGDGFAGCYCPECRKLVQDEQSEAAPLILLLNRALEIIEKTHPNLQVITFAYFNTLDAPKTLKPHRNLWINVVSSATSKNAAGDQMGPILDNPANDDYAKALKAWPKIAPNRVSVWHWDTYRADWPSMFYVDDNVRYMIDCGVYGINPQTCGGPWDQMLNWLYMKLAWNPNQDGDALIRQFLEDNYGKAAAPFVYAYLKTGQQAYADALHVPSAVRWSGWTRITMDKLFPESVRAEMTSLMDKAVAAAKKDGTEAELANLLSARAESLDKLVMEAAHRTGDWGMVQYQGQNWYVAGANPHVPGIIQRRKQALGNLQAMSGFARAQGGPAVALDGKAMRAVVCPDLAGQLISAIDKETGEELLDAGGADAGYCDLFGKIDTQLWLPLTGKEDSGRPDLEEAQEAGAMLWRNFRNPRSFWKRLRGRPGSQLVTETILSPKAFDSDTYLQRTVAVTEDGLRIDRIYSGDLKDLEPFNARWRLAMPEPRKSRISVSGGGIKELMDLRYAEPGGIRMVKAGERPPGYEGLDAMDEKWDAVTAVSDAQVVELAVREMAGDIDIRLDRGDGTATILRTPAAGWSTIKIKPVVGESYLELVLVGKPIEADGDRVSGFALPIQTLTTMSMPLGEAVEEASELQPRLRITGTNTAINEVDGAELIWIPAGTFTRGSDSDVAGADESPVREIELDGYWVYKYPVTVGEYKAYCAANGKEFKPPWPQGMKTAPIGDDDTYAVVANWFDARAYARWVGGDLPTEAQWEKAARGSDARVYPWGNNWNPDNCVSMENTLYRFEEGFRPVGSHPQGASPYGVMDMAGNLWEWTRDWYRYEYYGEAPDKNPMGPKVGANKVLRGGCAMYDWRFSRTTARFVQPPTVNDWTAVGFRVVISAPGPEK